jgi:hypothetical protein
MITFVRTAKGLLPWDKTTQDFLSSEPPGEPIVCQPWFDRDMFEHRKIFATIAEIAKATGDEPEALRAELLVETGHYHDCGELYGRTIAVVSSMSRHSMRDRELLAFWQEAKQVIMRKVLRRVADPATRQQLVHALSAQRV